MEINQSAVAIVNAIFKDLIAISPAFRQSWPTEREFSETKQQWVAAFIESKVSDLGAIEGALAMVRQSPSPFPPSVGQFIQWCKSSPQYSGLPSLQAAYEEACKNSHPAQGEKSWSHPAVRHAAHKTGSFFLRTESRTKTEASFKLAYEDACQTYLMGGSLDALEHTSKKQDAELLSEYVHWLKNLRDLMPVEVFFPCAEKRAMAARLYEQSREG